MGTALTPLDAVFVAISGIATVFLVLVGLVGLIHLISKSVGTKPTPAAEEALAEPKTEAPQTYTGEIQLLGVDEKTAACLMAIVSEETGIPLSQLVFKKIRALDGGTET